MPKKQKPFKHDSVRPFPISSAVRGAMRHYYEDVAISGKELIPLSACRLQLKISVLATMSAINMMANRNPFGMSSF